MSISKIPVRINFGNELLSVSVCCMDVCLSSRGVFAVCDVYSDGETHRICYTWGRTAAGIFEPRPRELQELSNLEGGSRVVMIGCANESAYCIVQKQFFHLNDQGMQDEKLDFLRELQIM